MNEIDDKKSKSFWATMPGILTAIAGLLGVLVSCIGLVLSTPRLLDIIVPSSPTPLELAVETTSTNIATTILPMITPTVASTQPVEKLATTEEKAIDAPTATSIPSTSTNSPMPPDILLPAPTKTPVFPKPNEWYRIVTFETEQCIHVQYANADDRNALIQWECLELPQFRFQFEPIADGYIRIRSHYGRCFHVQNASVEWRKELWQWECLDLPQFWFKLEPGYEQGYYRIKSVYNLCFHVRNGPSTERRAPLIQWECLDLPQFLFRFEEIGG